MQSPILFILCILGIVINLFTSDKFSSANPIVLLTEGIIICGIVPQLIRYYVTDSRQIRYSFYRLYLISLFCSLLLLYLCWTPYLNMADVKEGFDPQRYYIYATEYIKKGDFTGWVGGGLNGVVYIYAYVMIFGGNDPLVPLYFNSLLFLLQTLWLYKIYCHYCNQGREYIPFLLLIPEIIYYNVMTSKETLCMFGAVWILYELFMNSKQRSIIHIILLLCAMTFELYVRATFAVIIAFGYSLFLVLGNGQISISKKIVAIFVMVCGIYLGFSMGGSFITQDTIEEYQGLAISAVSGDNEATFDVSQSSLSGMLVPHNYVEMIFFGILRAFLYIMPDTSIITAFSKETTLFRFANFTQLLTGGLMALFIPLVFVSIWKMQRLKLNCFTPLVSIFVVLFFFISFSRPGMVHQRYRIVYDSIYFFLALLPLGYFSKKYIYSVMQRWLLIIFPAAVILIVYKFYS